MRLKLTGNARGVMLVVVVLVIIWFAMEAADAAELEDRPGLSLSFGLVTYGSAVCNFGNMTLGQTLGEDWQATMTVHGDGECRGEKVEANGGFCGLRNAHGGKWSIGFGGCVWIRDDVAVARVPMRDTPQITFAIQIRRFARNGKAFGGLLHGSTGGAYPINRGRNFLNGGWQL